VQLHATVCNTGTRSVISDITSITSLTFREDSVFL